LLDFMLKGWSHFPENQVVHPLKSEFG